MSTYRPAESMARIQVAIAESGRRKHNRWLVRRQLRDARRVGLMRRHQNKEALIAGRSDPTMGTKRRTPPVEDKEQIQELARLANAALPSGNGRDEIDGEEREREGETPVERAFRLTDEGLQSAHVNLRRLRANPTAREALKLVRQAQNLLMDAEYAEGIF